MKSTIAKKTQGYGYCYTELADINRYCENNDITYYQEVETNEINQKDYIVTYLIENGETNYFNIDLSDRNMVSGSWKYKFAIFDMIFIYKTFDWENDLMVVYGG